MANNYARAKEIIDKRRETAEREAERRRMELEATSPELRDVNRRIASAGLRVLRAIGMGEDTKRYLDDLARENLAAQEERKQILRDLGAPEDALAVHYTCPLCEDTGTHDNHYCECFLELVRELSVDELNREAPAKRCTFASFDLERYRGLIDPDTGINVYDQMAQIRQYCMDWSKDFGKNSPSLLLYGKTGLGKTHLSLAMANVVLGKGYDVVYGSAHNLLGQIEKERFGRQVFDESPEERLLHCDLLIMDDLGAEFATKFTVSAVYNLINTRLLAGAPTIISTNLMYDEIAEQYTERVYSRILGNFVPLEFLGRDNRQYE